jgi:hypothetical protein
MIRPPTVLVRAPASPGLVLSRLCCRAFGLGAL